MPAPSDPPSSTSHAVLAGTGFMLGGILLFSLNDAMGKWLLATFTVGQVLLVRSVAALLVLVPFICQQGWHGFVAAPRPWLQVLRVVLATAEVAFFYWAVIYLPLADVVTFYLAGPIFVTALSVVLLKEHVGWRRWIAVLVGFVGVIIAMRPTTATMSGPAVIALLGSLAFAVLMIVTRALRGTSDTVLVTTQTFAALVFGAIAAPFGWVTPTLGEGLLMALLGVVAMTAHACVNRSLKLAPAPIVVPYQYTMIIWASVLGYLVFGDVPDAALVIGAAIIIAAGLFIFLREQALARRPSAQ